MSHPTTTRPITARRIGERVIPAAAATTIPSPTTIAAIPKAFSPALLMPGSIPDVRRVNPSPDPLGETVGSRCDAGSRNAQRPCHVPVITRSSSSKS
jgi:hypothetical protein